MDSSDLPPPPHFLNETVHSAVASTDSVLHGTTLTNPRKDSAGPFPLSTRNFNPEASTSATLEPPTGLTVTVRGYLVFALDWTQPSSGAVSYKVEWSTDSGSNWSVLVDNLVPTGYDHISNLLTPGATFQYRVISKDADNNESQPSSVASGTAVAQSTTNLLTNVSATRASATSITVTADPPADATINAITPIFTNDDGNTWQNLTLIVHAGASQWSHTFTGLTTGVCYGYRFRIGNDDFSDEAYASTGTVSAPSAPSGLTATADGETAIDLSWTAPTANKCGTITGYKIEVSTDGGSTFSDLVASHGMTTYSHTGLSAGDTRHYRVSAINSGGTSAVSSVANATTDGTAATIPGAPTSLTATASGQTTINLSWTAPSDGGAAISSYRILVSTDGTSFTELVASHTSTSYSHTGLAPNTTRYYSVSALNSVGRGPESSEVNATTAAGGPSAPTNLTATAIGPSLINLSWDAPTNTGDGLVQYNIEQSTNGDAESPSWSWTLSSNHPRTTQLVVNRTAATTYWYRVRAVDSTGVFSPYSNIANATTADLATAPGAPTSLTATADGPTAINLSWTAPTSTGGTAITGYRIYVAADFSDDWTAVVATTGNTNTSYSHTGLRAGIRYEYRVLAINAATNIGSNSNSAAATTGAATIPGAPTSLTAAADGQTTIDLSWTAPTSNGGAAISGYRIEVSTNGGSSFSQLVASQSGTSYSHTGLTAGTARHYRVRAINSVGNSGWSNTANATTADSPTATAPGAPTSLTAAADGQTTIDLSWTAPTSDGGAAISGYRIDVSTNGGSSFSQLVASQSGTSYSHTGLTAGTARHYRVRAINSVGNSGWSNTANATTADSPTATAPGAPTSLTAAADGQTTIDLSWTAPTSDGGAAISGYRIEVSTNGGSSFSQLVASHSTTSYSHTGLTAGTARHYRVRAINSVGSSGWSNTANATTAAATAPGVPTSLTAAADGQTTIDLSWTAPTSDGGAAISGYRIEVSTNGGSSFSQLVASHSTTSYSHTGLTAGTARHYRVRAINSVGNSGWSSTANATTVAATATFPDAPTELTATASGQTIINLSWTAPRNTGGAPISDYRILVSEDGIDFTTILVSSHTTTSYSHTGLAPGTTRYYRVSAINSVDRRGPVSNTANATTATRTATVPGAPISLTTTADGSTIINLSWTVPASNGGAAISGYRIEVSIDGGTNFSQLVARQSTTSYSHTGLSAGSARHYRVRAINAVGNSAWSNTANATTDAATAPTAPRSLTATAVGQTTIYLSWTAPARNGGAAISGYRIEVSTDGGTNFSQLVASQSATTYSHTGLSAGDTRHYRVRAINSEGNSPWSNTANATTGAATATFPDAPTELTATASGQTIIHLSWSAPRTTGGAPISGYRILVSADGIDFTTILVSSHTITSYSHTGLAPGTTRYYRVSAINSVGRRGPVSNTANATTATPTATAPTAPRSLRATASGQTIINLSWSAPSSMGGADIRGYRIEVSTNGGSSFSQLVASHSTTSYSHTGLTAGTARHYRVRAINSVGNSGWSNTANATTASLTATVPGVPTSLTATASGQTIINLSWTAPTSDGGAAISGYRIEVSTNGGSSFSQLVASQSGTSYSHTGLTAGTARHYRVRAINSVGSSGWSNTANATTASPTATAPGAPTSLTATASGQTIINLSWTAPTSDGGAAISGYRIEVSTNGGSSFSQLVASQSGTSYSHTGLTAGTARHYRVRAINSVGSSGWSNTANATTAVATATVPTAPRSLSATADRQTIINLSWTASANTGGSPITGYRIQWSANGTSGWQNVSPAHTGTGRTYADTGLNPGTTRHYRVYARNSVGESAQPSDVANATTATTGTVTAPSAPRSLRATASGQTIINLSWSAPSSMGGASIRGYRIEVSDDGGTNWTDLVASHSETTYSHTGLTAGSTRYYRVYAINAEGLESLPSDVDSATTTTSGTTTDIVVSFVVASSQVNENVATVAVQINVNPAPTSSLTVLYSLGGTATQTTDYTTQGAGSLTVAANATSANLSIAITNDQVDESDETIIVTLTSGTGYDIGSQSVYTLTIVDDDDPDVPPLTFAETIPNQSFIVGVPIDEVVLADAVGGTPPYRFALTPDPPAGLEFDASTRSISGTSSASMSVTTYTYTVTDDDNATAIQTFTIEVIVPPDLALADSVADQIYPVGKAIADLVLPNAMGGAPPYVYALTPDLPKGIAFDAETRTLSGTPSEVTDSKVYTYTVKDRAGTSSKLDFEMEVYTITFTETVPNQSYPRGQAIDPLVLPEVTGGVPPIQYTLTLLDLSYYLKFDAPSRTISGTPLEVIPPISLTYKAMDQNGVADSLVFSIGVISPVHIEENPGIPQEFQGYSNYPNPFHSSTNLVFDLPWPAQVQVEVMDVTGRRLVSTPSEYLTAGWGHEMLLSDLNLPSGAYLYRIHATSLDDRSSSVYVGHFMSVK